MLAAGCRFEPDIGPLVLATVPPQPFSAFAPTQPTITEFPLSTPNPLELREFDDASTGSTFPGYLGWAAAALAGAGAGVAAVAAAAARRRRFEAEGEPTPTPTYHAPTATSTPPSPSPSRMPSATPSATAQPTRTPTASPTPSPRPMLPTNTPGTSIVDFEKLPRQAGSAAGEFVDSFSLVPDKPSALDAFQMDYLTPLEASPYTAWLVPPARLVLTALATLSDFFRPFRDTDPTYPGPEPIPYEPSGGPPGGDRAP